MEKLHTPEPWIEAGPSYGKPHPVEINSIVPVNIEEGELVEDICTFDHSNNHEQNAANARRIVACVNACRDIDMTVLEMPNYSVKSELDTLDAQIAGRLKAESQRDELLAALKALYYGCVKPEMFHLGAATPTDEIIVMVEKALENA